MRRADCGRTMYDGAGAQRIALNFKSLSPLNLRDPYAAKFYIASSHAAQNFKILLKF